MTMQFGIYFPPGKRFERGSETSKERDLIILEYADKLGFDYAWFAEDYLDNNQRPSKYKDLISIATNLTQDIKIGAGIAQPNNQKILSLASQIARLDNTTQERISFGIGPGFLPSDSPHTGVSNADLDLLTSCIKTAKSKFSDWDFKQTANGLPSNLPPEGNLIPSEMFIASQSSPIAAVLAGWFGLGMLSLGAVTANGFNNLPYIWEIYDKSGSENAHNCDRSRWSLAMPMHLAETDADARRDVEFGLNQWIKELQENTTFMIPEESNAVDQIIETGLGVIGTHLEAITKIRELRQQSGGFGCLLLTTHNWVDLERTKQSLKIFQDHVINKI